MTNIGCVRSPPKRTSAASNTATSKRAPSKPDHDPARERGRDAVHQLQQLHHPGVDLALAGADAADDFGGAVVRVHFLARAARGHVGFDDRRQRLDHPDIAVLQGMADRRSEEHTSELQSLMRKSYADFCLKKKTQQTKYN